MCLDISCFDLWKEVIKVAPNKKYIALPWRHYEFNGVSNHRRLDCLLKRWFERRSQKTSKPTRHWPLCVGGGGGGDPPVSGGYPHKGDSNAENVSIWWRYHGHTNFLKGVCYLPTSCVTVIHVASYQPAAINPTTLLMFYWFCLSLCCLGDYTNWRNILRAELCSLYALTLDH